MQTDIKNVSATYLSMQSANNFENPQIFSKTENVINDQLLCYNANKSQSLSNVKQHRRQNQVTSKHGEMKLTSDCRYENLNRMSFKNQREGLYYSRNKKPVAVPRFSLIGLHRTVCSLIG
jgi:hypothetical protein